MLDGELCNDRARPKHIGVKRDVVPEDLGEDPPLLQPPVQHLMPCPHPGLHHPILRQIRIISGAFEFVGVAAVALVGLAPLARLTRIKEVANNLVENDNISLLTSTVGILDPDAKISTSSL